MKERGPGQELTLSFASSFFCCQVFFVYDPSSSTSLLSSVSSDQEKCERGDGQGDGGCCEGPVAGAHPRTADACGVPTNVLLLLCCFAGLLLQLCCFLCKAAGPALRGSSQAPPPSSCDLLLPGLL